MLCIIKKKTNIFESDVLQILSFRSQILLQCYESEQLMLLLTYLLPAFFGSLFFHISPVLYPTEKWLMISVRPFRFGTHCQIYLSRLLVVVGTNYSFLQTYSIFFFCVEHIFCISSIPYENTLETPYSDPEFSPLNVNRFYNHWENLNSKFQGT